MENAREKAISIIMNLPTDISLDEIINRLKFINCVNKGIEDLENNKIISHEESKKVLRKWLE
jgi:translation initiation factor 2B subunit (eIF-2B alpha/beta/delta family)